jgi:hypothetical protein
MIDFLPLWLAKISITPKMKKNNPELVEKLIQYQLKAKDVLAAAFLPQQYHSPEIEAILKQFQAVQQQVAAHEKAIMLFSAEKARLESENVQLITTNKTLEKDLRTQIHIHPLSAKRERVINKIREDLFHNEFTDVATQKLYNEALNSLQSIGIKKIKAIIRELGCWSFGKQFTIKSYDSTLNNHIKQIKNIEYTQKLSFEWVQFNLAMAFIYLYYDDIVLDKGYRNTRYQRQTNSEKTFVQWYEFDIFNFKMKVVCNQGLSIKFIRFERYDNIINQQKETCSKIPSISEYLIAREIICKLLFED